MTKKDYIAIAKILNGIWRSHQDDSFDSFSTREIIELICDEMCSKFKESNPLFSVSKFKQACFLIN